MNKIEQQKKQDAVMSVGLGLLLGGFGFAVGSGLLEFFGILLVVLGVIIYSI